MESAPVAGGRSDRGDGPARAQLLAYRSRDVQVVQVVAELHPQPVQMLPVADQPRMRAVLLVSRRLQIQGAQQRGVKRWRRSARHTIRGRGSVRPSYGCLSSPAREHGAQHSY
jgi:hypothetical protein